MVDLDADDLDADDLDADVSLPLSGFIIDSEAIAIISLILFKSLLYIFIYLLIYIYIIYHNYR